jgi:cytochrome c oxidase cbb3-type subunit 3
VVIKTAAGGDRLPHGVFWMTVEVAMRGRILLAVVGAMALRGQQTSRIPNIDPAAVERGQKLFTANCGFCHGANAKGGESGPDLIRSVLVLDDEGGKDIGAVLKAGRQDQGMPKFDLPSQQVSDIAAFLHKRVTDAAFRQTYTVLDVLTGNGKEGEAYFSGAGGCAKCHSPTGDFKGIGSKYAAEVLQDRIVMPPRGRGNADKSSLRPTATITVPGGKTFSGVLVRLTDFDVTIKDASNAVRTFSRVTEDNPKIERKDPLQAHMDMLSKWKDSDIHNLTAYLVTLK